MFQMQILCQNENSPLERTPLNMYNKFIERVRRNLHVVLAFSPIGDAFRNRIRMFPSLINCCTIDWFKVSLFYLGLDVRKPVFEGLQTTQAQTSLCTCAV